MALVLTSGPPLEPVTVAEAKAHCRIDDSSEDILIASLILTSRLHIEAALGLALIDQSWQLTLDSWPREGPLILPLRPVQSVTAVRVLAADGTPQTLAPESYRLDGAAFPPRLVTENVWPSPAAADPASRSISRQATVPRRKMFPRRSARRCCCSSRIGSSIATPSRPDR